MNSIRVLIGGDLCPIGINNSLFRRGDAAGLFHDLLQEFERADLVAANLECPLIERPRPIAKTGPTFGEDGDCIEGIRTAGIDLLSLANNHIFDHGPEGLANTLAVCGQAGIATVGAGPNLAAARRILVRNMGGVRVGVIAVAEHEFSIATPNTPGANPFDLVDFVRNVSASRDEFDYLIVLYHGGPEFLTTPSPQLQDTCRFLVEMGANAVVVQHPHSLGGYEKYRAGHIVYGQGALVMDEAIYRNRESFHEGILVCFDIPTNGGEACMRLLPFVQSIPEPGARRMHPQQADVFLRGLEAKSSALLDAEYVKNEWKRFCEEQKHSYLSALLGHNRLLQRANRHGRLAHLLYPRRRMLGTRNTVCCETHREALETIFKEGMV